MDKPDYIYDPNYWEVTYEWDHRDELVECSPPDPGRIIEFATLIKGPPMFAACVVLTRDEDGDADETEVQWFSTRLEAEKAAG